MTPEAKPYRLPTLWITVMAEGHGAAIMQNGRVGYDEWWACTVREAIDAAIDSAKQEGGQK